MLAFSVYGIACFEHIGYLRYDFAKRVGAAQRGRCFSKGHRSLLCNRYLN